MSWLRNHMRHFVIPGIHALARADGKVVLDRDIKPSDRRVRASSKCTYAEAGMLLAVCSSILRKSNPLYEISRGLCREVGKGNDAQFVYECDLGGRGVANRVYGLGEGYDGVEGADVLHSFISNSVKELKRRTRKKSTAIYPGRDVWCWEVMSKRLGMPSHYDSKVSRSIAMNPKAIAKVIAPWQIPDWEKTVLFDTGHQGTVPLAIGKAAGIKNPNVVMLSAIDPEYQIFRTHAKSRKKALACEYLAKYRKRAVVRNDEAYQEIADLEEFIKSALLTIWLWYHVSPGRLPSWRDEEHKSDPSKLKWAKNNSIFNTFTPVAANTGISINSTNWATAATGGSSPIFVTSGSGNTIDIGNWGAATNWDTHNTTVTAATTIDGMWGQGTSAGAFVDIIDQQTQQISYLKDKYQRAVAYPSRPVTPAIDPQTFRLIDPVSKAPLEPAMDAKSLGLDPVQYEIQRARKEALDNAKSRLASMGKPIDKSLTSKVNIHAPPYGPPRVQHTITMDKQTGQAVRNTVVSQDLPGSLQAIPPAPAGVNKADHMKAMKAKIYNSPPSTPVDLGAFKGGPLKMFEPPPPGVQLDAAGNVVADNRPSIPLAPPGVPILDHLQNVLGSKSPLGIKSPSQSSLPPSGSVIGTTPTPTTGLGGMRVVPNSVRPVTDGKGKPITG